MPKRTMTESKPNALLDAIKAVKIQQGTGN